MAGHNQHGDTRQDAAALGAVPHVTPDPGSHGAAAEAGFGAAARDLPGQMARTKKARKQTPKRRRTRGFANQLPVYLPRATEFTDDPVLGNPDWVVQTLLAYRQQLPFIDELIEKTTIKETEGRPRLVGSAALTACAYVASKKPSMETFWKDYGQNKFWELAGFKPNARREPGYEHRPSARTFNNYMEELETDEFLRAFEKAGDACLAIARKHEPRIGRDVAVDATRYAAPCRSYHCCEPATCPRNRGKRAAHATVEPLSSPKEVDDARKELIEMPPMSSEEERAMLRSSWVGKDGWRYAKHDGCVFKWIDTDARFRSYVRKDGTKSTVLGGYDMAATDHLTGGIIEGVVFGAHRQEHMAIPALVRRIERAMAGDLPETLSGDKALTNRKTARFLARRKIALVSPFRRQKHAQDEAGLRTDRWDEYGPRCEHCGGPSTQHGAKLGLMLVRGEPVIRHRCELGATPDCARIQTVRCEDEYLVLRGLSPRTERYQALQASQRNLERTHFQKRRRFAVAGNDNTGKLKRRGIQVHRLRAATARFLEWFYICLRHGWIGGHKFVNPQKIQQRRAWMKIEQIINRRRNAGLHLPYGRAAIRLGLAPPLPPPGGSP